MLSLILKKEYLKEFHKGNPWIWKSAIELTSELETASPGELVKILDKRAKPIGIGYINPSNTIACRVLSFRADTQINHDFFYRLFAAALAKRQKLFSNNFYRLIHSESDFLPGLIIDRFDDIVVCQTSTAGMEKLKHLWLPALETLLTPQSIILRDDVPSRTKEGLALGVSIYKGRVPELVEVKENNRIYVANLITGQKTGWFYDQRENRTYLSTIANNKTVLDLYSHSGGFGIAACKGNALNVTMVDSSAMALELAQQAAFLNNCQSSCSFIRSDAYDFLEHALKNQQYFDIVMADPPAFIKERKYIATGLKGYQKLAGLCARLTKEGGVFAIASCSHHANAEAFKNTVEEGIKKSGKSYKLIRKSGADKDHPVHKCLPESGYLKFLAYMCS